MLTALRGMDAIVRNSLFRGGYELLFMPMDARTRNRVKAVLDVICDRVGEAAGLGGRADRAGRGLRLEDDAAADGGDDPGRRRVRDEPALRAALPRPDWARTGEVPRQPAGQPDLGGRMDTAADTGRVRGRVLLPRPRPRPPVHLRRSSMRSCRFWQTCDRETWRASPPPWAVARRSTECTSRKPSSCSPGTRCSRRRERR